VPIRFRRRQHQLLEVIDVLAFSRETISTWCMALGAPRQ
jgi:hypothetical protein